MGGGDVGGADEGGGDVGGAAEGGGDVGGGGDGGSKSLTAQSSSPPLMLSAQGLATPAVRLVSGEGGSGRPPPLAAARVRGRFAGGDPAGGDDPTVEGASPMSVAAVASAAAGGASGRAVLPLSARRCLLILSRPGLRRRRRGGGRLSRRTSSAPKPQADLLAVPVSFQNQFCWPPLLPASQPRLKLRDGAGRGAGRVVGGAGVLCTAGGSFPLLSSPPPPATSAQEGEGGGRVLRGGSWW